MNRRKFIRASSVGTLMTMKHVVADGYGLPTPNEIEGPFYPVSDQKDKDFDLTQINGGESVALGKHIFITGRVFDTKANPLKGVRVDLWQANAAGKYRHPRDPNPALMDENFQGWAIISTQKDGAFKFKTVMPGAYPVNHQWTRPPHIHFKITKAGYQDLVTQMYFPNQALNKVDKLFQRKNIEEQKFMVAKKVQATAETYSYDIVIEKV